MSDNKRLNVPLTYVRGNPANQSATTPATQNPSSARGPGSGYVVPQNIATSLGASYVASQRRLSKSRDPSASKDKIKQTGGSMISLTLMRIVNRKMYDHLHTIKDQKRKGLLKRAFLKTLSLLERDRTNYHKAYAWMALLKNCYQADKALAEKTARGVEKATESNLKKCLMILRRRSSGLIKLAVEKMKKKAKIVVLMQTPVSILSHMFHRKILNNKAYSLLRLKLQAYKKKNQFKIGSAILKNLYRSKLSGYFNSIRISTFHSATAQTQLTASTSRITITPGKGSRVTQVTTPARKTPAPAARQVTQGPSEDEKLNTQLQQLAKQKEAVTAKGQEDLAALEEQVQEMQRRIAEEEEKRKSLAQSQAQHHQQSHPQSQHLSPTKSAITQTSSDPYYQVLRNIYEFSRSGPDTLRKRDLIQRFELDLSQLQDTVEHELDRNQQLKDTINNIEDFLCPDQAIERPELQIDEANRLLEHENSQLRKVLQRYLVESYGKNLLEESKKVCAMLSERLQKAQ